MWFEILPAMFIIAGCVALSPFASAMTNGLILGNRFRRRLSTDEQRLHYHRDYRRFGSPYANGGLENIPDDECPCKHN